jgi:hypothetical protein
LGYNCDLPGARKEARSLTTISIFIQVDDEAFITILSDDYHGWVNLIKLDWELSNTASVDSSREPVEGLKIQDVGWMRADIRSMMVLLYCTLRDWDV